MYRNEAAFSKAFCGRLKRLGLTVTRVESGGTRRGIPDIHWVGFGQEGWIELKNVHYSYYKKPIKVPWRPGQQAWALDYYRAKKTPSLTVVACNNCILVVPMVRPFKENWVSPEDISDVWSSIGEVAL
jgi:hypothetical protein